MAAIYERNGYGQGFGDTVNLPDRPNGRFARNVQARGSPWHPRNWALRTKLCAGFGAVVLLIIIVVPAVVVTRNNRYPAYSKLNYTLKDTYQGSTFFDNFNYFTGYDPSQGFVHYVDGPGSKQLNLTYATTSSAVLRVDTSETDASTGRKSARIESKNQYDNGLFVFDIAHTPYGCATWPALWLSDQSNWPNNGEIDVVESVNQGTTGNQATLHTSAGCEMDVKRIETGNVLSTDCLNSTNSNAGCGVQGPTDTYGPIFNANGGGVYAMELRSDGIRTWFFARSSIPVDIATGTSPDPSSWGTAFADFPNTDCNIGDHFRNQSIIANIDICGVWAGSDAVYTTQGSCPGVCTTYAATNATAFTEAYWQWNYFKVFQAS